MRDHRKLDTFQSADALVLEIYRATKRFPADERKGLTTQMRRAAVSVAANIAEGCARRTERELIRFLEIAFGSLRELEYFISLSERLGYYNQETAESLLRIQCKAARQLYALMRALAN